MQSCASNHDPLLHPLLDVPSIYGTAIGWCVSVLEEGMHCRATESSCLPKPATNNWRVTSDPQEGVVAFDVFRQGWDVHTERSYAVAEHTVRKHCE